MTGRFSCAAREYPQTLLTVPSLPVVTTSPVGNVCTHNTVPKPSGLPLPRETVAEFTTWACDLLPLPPEEVGRDRGRRRAGTLSLTTILESSSKPIVNCAANCSWKLQ